MFRPEDDDDDDNDDDDDDDDDEEGNKKEHPKKEASATSLSTLLSFSSSAAGSLVESMDGSVSPRDHGLLKFIGSLPPFLLPLSPSPYLSSLIFTHTHTQPDYELFCKRCKEMPELLTGFGLLAITGAMALAPLSMLKNHVHEGSGWMMKKSAKGSSWRSWKNYWFVIKGMRSQLHQPHSDCLFPSISCAGGKLMYYTKKDDTQPHKTLLLQNCALYQVSPSSSSSSSSSSLSLFFWWMCCVFYEREVWHDKDKCTDSISNQPNVFFSRSFSV